MEPLLPTLRYRRRYIAVEVLCDVEIQRGTFIKHVFSNACSLLGDEGVAKSGLTVLGFENNKGIIRCNHKSVQNVVCALAMISNINGSKVIVRVFGVSGTVKGATRKYLMKND